MAKAYTHFNIYADGGARGNPGPAGIGVVIFDDKGERVKDLCKSIGNATNNIAEYNAVIYGLQEALILKADEVDLFIDSELVAKQLSGEFRVKNENIRKVFEQALYLIKEFKSVRVNAIPREKNREADKLVNKALNLRV